MGFHFECSTGLNCILSKSSGARYTQPPVSIADSERVLDLYNQEHGEERERVTDNVKEWFVDAARELGWTDADFHGDSCVLSVDIVKVKKD